MDATHPPTSSTEVTEEITIQKSLRHSRMYAARRSVHQWLAAVSPRTLEPMSATLLGVSENRGPNVVP